MRMKMSIQQDIQRKIEEYSDPTYADLLLELIEKIEKGTVSHTKIKESILYELTELVIEEEGR